MSASNKMESPEKKEPCSEFKTEEEEYSQNEEMKHLSASHETVCHSYLKGIKDRLDKTLSEGQEMANDITVDDSGEY